MSADPTSFFNSNNISISDGQQQSSTSSSGPGKAILEVAIIVSIVAIIGIIARAAIRWHCSIDKRFAKCLDGDVETPQTQTATTTSQQIQQHDSSPIRATTAPTTTTTGQPPAPPTAQPPPAPTTAQPPPPPTRQPPAPPARLPPTIPPIIEPIFVVPNPPHYCTGAPHILPAAHVHPLYTYPVAYYSSCRCQRCCREE